MYRKVDAEYTHQRKVKRTESVPGEELIKREYKLCTPFAEI